MADNVPGLLAPREKTRAAALGLLVSGCAGLAPHGGPRLEAVLPEARLLFVGAHPDDETVAGPILARACLALARPCRLVLLTRGEGGRCDRAGGCGADLARHRTREMERVASAYGAELVLFDYPNAPLPWSSFPTVEAQRRAWSARSDPVRRLVRELRDFRPTVVLTFDPEGGFTEHPEHRLSAALADEALARAATEAHPELGPPHATERVYRVLNRYWLPVLLGTADPSPPNEAFDNHVSCRPYRATCLDAALDLTRLHESQAEDMGLVRALRPQMGRAYLRLVSPRGPAPRRSTLPRAEAPPGDARSD